MIAHSGHVATSLDGYIVANALLQLREGLQVSGVAVGLRNPDVAPTSAGA